MSTRRMKRTWRAHRRGAGADWAGPRERLPSLARVPDGLPGWEAPSLGRTPLPTRWPESGPIPLTVEIVGEATILRAALERVVRSLPSIGSVTVLDLDQRGIEAGSHAPDVILVVVQGDDDIAILWRRLLCCPEARALAVAETCDQDRLRRLIEAGSSGCVLFESDPGDVAQAIRAAADGRVFIDPASMRLLASGTGADAKAKSRPRLSERHTEILRLLAAGLPNKLIAQRLAITEKTVKTHLTAIFRLIGVSDRVRAALWAEQHLAAEEPQDPLGPE